jgi:hypothetical protein
MKTLLTFTLLLIFCHAFGQQKLQGNVADIGGQPLSKATVFISESKAGTTTDSLGNFSLTTSASGSLKLVVSYIGYETQVKSIVPGAQSVSLNFVLKPISNQLKEVIVTSRSNNSWKEWGTVFTEAFIGKSAFASHCSIVDNKEISLVYNKEKQTLRAYASAPIMVKNEDLGYILTITLIDFTLYTTNNDVDYQAYYLFQEMRGSNDQQAKWELNRRKIYALSLMHFTRALYDNKLKEEGFEVRQFLMSDIKEQLRVKKIYNTSLALLKDSLKKAPKGSAERDRILERNFNKDSLAYYKKVIAGEDGMWMSGLLKAADISVKKDKIVVLNFKDALQVVYKKIKEPEEYNNYRIKLATGNITVNPNSISTGRSVLPPREYPFTEMWLTKGQPVEVMENGHITNTNLYLQGFWGWWEKVATKLPYDYYPD